VSRTLAALALVVGVALAACSHASSTGSGAVATSTSVPSEFLVAFGSSAGYAADLPDRFRLSWPQLLYRDAFPISTVFVNLSNDPTTLDQAVRFGLPVALEQHATIAAIWLGPGSGECGPDTTATRFASVLASLVQPLRAAGARVVIGTVPDRVPCAVAFNAAVMNVARAQRATIADVASALAATPTIGPNSSVTVAESRAIASAFGAAVARS
jgi:hypothetical protein